MPHMQVKRPIRRMLPPITSVPLGRRPSEIVETSVEERKRKESATRSEYQQAHPSPTDVAIPQLETQKLEKEPPLLFPWDDQAWKIKDNKRKEREEEGSVTPSSLLKKTFLRINLITKKVTVIRRDVLELTQSSRISHSSPIDGALNSSIVTSNIEAPMIENVIQKKMSTKSNDGIWSSNISNPLTIETKAPTRAVLTSQVSSSRACSQESKNMNSAKVQGKETTRKFSTPRQRILKVLREKQVSNSKRSRASSLWSTTKSIL